MQNCQWKDLSLSRLMLGTVQFGLPYGVANRTGQPEYREVLAMLEAAVAGGVNCLDTAAAYGTSEEVLGRALQELKLQDAVVVVTKVHWLRPDELADPQLARQAIVRSVEQSRQRLQLDRLPVVLFHREADAAYGHVLEELRERGWLQHAGVSCDNRPGPALQFAEDPQYSALQIPCNLLDPRHLRSGVMERAIPQDVAIFIRSVYLQGLLTMSEDQVPERLRELLPARRRLETIAQEAGLRLQELAVRFMLSQPGVTCVLTGVESLQQVEDNLAVFNRGPLPDHLLQVTTDALPDLPESLVTPSQWS